MESFLFCLVIAISDGDTLKARCGPPERHEQVTVRLADIDAPESRQPFGQASKRSLSDLCYSVEAVIQPTAKDRYRRTVANVHCKGVNASRHQVSSGMAWVFDRYVQDQTLYSAQESARSSRKGIWSDREPVPPWEWRKNGAAVGK